ncbi:MULTISPECIES: YrrS family protein [Virgibacillus]|uniref:YrrS family protein n=1 Tax=Virgibacillus TaxID=84406 RepID=UPI000388674F|nr:MULTISPECIES: YrrS family protein [Virgibacillus]EQB35879.1 hypothetical protein M948_12630 [Virgibacillus sp. CM-4]MYL41681.1 DUF1510 family protein [Virgibacillus massiliensis]
MSDLDKGSRLNKFEKRRKNTKSISILLVVVAILIIIFLGFLIFGGGEDNTSEETDSSNSENQSEQEENNNEDNNSSGDQFTRGDSEEDAANKEDQDQNNDQQESTEEDTEAENNAEVEKEQVESSNSNVVEAYTGDWEPIGTEQEGPHTTNYNDGSQDRIEIARAAAEVTGLDESSMVTHWVGNGGDQKVEATVSNSDNTEIYRVYLSWVDNNGWKPTKVEKLNQVETN